jgi:hypothetical protein
LSSAELAAIRASFAEVFDSWEITLPPDAGRTKQAGAVPNERGWSIRFRFTDVDGEVVMHLFAEHRMTNARLYRLRGNGSIETLGVSLDILANMNADTREQERKFFELVGNLTGE